MTIITKLRLLLGLNRVYEDAVKESHMTDAKSILLSRTFWFNVIAGVIGICQSEGLLAAIPAPWGPVIVMVGNLVLRYVTTKPVTLLPQ
jgi:hypothetical protein